MRLLKLSAASAAAGVVTVAAVTGLIIPAAASAASGNATVTVVHGIPNTPVDVYANGKKIIQGFTFKTVTQPLSLPPAATPSMSARPARRRPASPS